MSGLSIRIDTSQMARMKAAIADTGRNLRKELAIAVNTTAKKSQATIAKQLSKDLNLNKKVVTRAVKITRGASTDDISATVEVNKDKRFNLTSFGAKQTKTGVRYKTLRGGSTKVAQGAFQIDRWGGRTFKRKGKKRGPIQQLRGPSPWGRFVVGKMIEPTAAETESELKKQVDRRIRFIIGKSSGAF